MSRKPIHRPAARVVILDPNDRILLLEFVSPHSGPVWITPGGAVHSGETPEAAAVRELHEELGLQGFDLGPRVWVREHVFEWGDELWRQTEDFFLLRVQPFEIRPTLAEGLLEWELLKGHRWWTLEEIDSAPLDVKFAPRNLGLHLRALLTQGPPLAPVDVGV